ncbi:MAG: AAA family ATPase, partial [Thermoleophilia bacterium]|nr:AAA family ATPase [Thermoleophilia bacterium]
MIACPGCGFEAPDDFAFCPRCGTALAAPLLIPEERKVVSMLFCDLVGFTAMSEAVDPEDVDALLGRYHRVARSAIESHGGIVEKFIGDAVVGVFGVPAVHEDDAERAVRAALRLVEALEGVTCPDGSLLEVRVGVNTGEALVRPGVDPASGRGLVAGDAVNVAARLQAAAPPGGVAVGALSHELTTRVIEYAELPPVAAKGKAKPVRAWRALAAVARRGIDVRGGDLTPLVGRERQLAHLAAVFDEVATRSKPRFVLLVGEPGIGKSRLVHEFAHALDERPGMFTWRQGYCPPFGEGVTYRALAEILKGHAGVRDGDDVAAVEAKLDAVLPSDPDREWLRQRLRALLGLAAPDAGREENFAAWVRFLELVAAAGSTVLVFEDLHWADEALLAFLEYLTTHIASIPLMVAGTTRPDLLERHPGFATGSQVDRLELEPLSTAETVRLVASLLGEPDDRAAVIGQVAERCGGNPFYAEQSVRLLGDTAPEAPLPDSVQAVIAARLDALPAEQKALLADAAVVGSVFWDGVLTTMGPRDPRQLGDLLSGLLARQLIRRLRASTMAGEREFAFVHALAREVAYRQLPRVARARRHAAVATWLEKKAGDRADDSAEVLAHHYATAHDLALAAGESDLALQLEGPLLRSLTAAGDRALNLDFNAAERFYKNALKLSSEGSSERAYLEFRLGETALWSGRHSQAEKLLQRTVDVMPRTGDRRSAAVALVRLARVREDLGRDPHDIETLFRKALGLLQDDGPSVALVTVLTEWGRDRLQASETDDALAAFTRALAVACEIDAPEPALALCLRGMLRAELGDDGFMEDLRRALEAAEAQGLGTERSRIWDNYAYIAAVVLGPRRSLEECDRALEFQVSRGLPLLMGCACSRRVYALVYAGEWEAVMRLASKAERDPVVSRSSWVLLETRLARLLVLAWRGASDEALRELAPALDDARARIDETPYGLMVGAVVTGQDDPEGGRR